MTKLEKACRLVCEIEGVDPDKEGYGLGILMPQGTKYPLWKAREKAVSAIIELLEQIEDSPK